MKPRGVRLVPMPVPVGGFVEGMSGASQPPNTYCDGQNVRSQHAASEQVGLTPRPGLRRVADFGTGIRELFVAGRELRPHLWSELNLTPKATVPSVVAQDGTTDTRATAIALAQGIDGTLYVLREDGAVDIFNAERRYLTSIESPVPRGFTPIERLEVDESGGIYLVGTRSDLLDGATSRVYRLRERGDVYELHWELPVVQPVVDIAYTRNSLYLYADPLPEGLASDQTPDQRASLMRVTQVFSSLPSLAWSRVAPQPAHRVIGMSDGSAVFMSPANALRNDAQDTAYTERGINWTPRELSQWNARVHAWIDGVRPTDGFFSDADTPVDRLADARRFTSSLTATTDATIRELVVDPDRDFDSARWLPEAFGGLGGSRFVSQTSMYSGPNRDIADVALQEALFPGIAGETWAAFFVLEFDAEAMEAGTVYRVVSQAGSPTQLGLYFTAELVGSDVRINVLDISGLRGSVASSAVSRAMLVTIVHNGAAAGTSRLRLDGAHVANASFSQIVSGGPWDLGVGIEAPGPRTVFGAMRTAADHNLALGATTWELWKTGGATQHAGRLRDGRKVGGASNRMKLLVGSWLLRARFAPGGTGDEVTLDGIAAWTSNIGSQAKTVRVRALSGGFSGTGSLVFEQEFTLEQRFSDTQFPVRDWLDFEQQVTAEYWEVELLAAHGSGGDWGVTEFEFLRRSEQQVLTLAEPAGVDSILPGAPFNLGTMLVLRNPTEPGAVNGTGPLGSLPSAVTEVEAIEGYLSHRFGISHQLPVDHPYYGPGNVPSGTGDDRFDQASEIALNSTLPIVARVSSASELLWARACAGVGLGAVEGLGNALYTIGEAFPSTGDALTTDCWGTWLRRWLMDGRTLSDTHPSAWGLVAAAPGEDAQVRQYVLSLDAVGDLYLPRYRRDGVVTLDRRKQEDGAAVFALPAPAGERALAFVPQVGPALRNPGDAVTAGVARAVALFRGPADALRSYPLMGQSPSGAIGVRQLEIVAVGAYAVYAHDAGGVRTVANNVALGEDLWSATGFGQTFIGGERGYRVYDHEFRTLRAFEGSTKGTFPPRCRLGVFWGGRLWLSGGDEPFEWYMSRWGDPYDMELFPEVPDEAQPVSSSSSPLGPLRDAARCLMPWTSDIAYVGCDSTLWRIEGDPATNGRIVPVANIGVAFGQSSYTLDDRGNLYFFASHGDVMMVRVGSGQPISISSTRINARLRDIDLKVWRPKLAWNAADRTLHVFLIRRDWMVEPGIHHFVWQADFDAWHPDTYIGGAERAVTAALSFPGASADDRTIYIACGDGVVRRSDRYADDDDGIPRWWRFVTAPLASGVASLAQRVTALDVRGVGSGMAHCSVWGTDVPHQPGVWHEYARRHSSIVRNNSSVAVSATGPLVYVSFSGTETPLTINGIVAHVAMAGRFTR